MRNTIRTQSTSEGECWRQGTAETGMHCVCSDSVSDTFFILDSSLIAVSFLAVVIQLIDMNSKVVSYFNDMKDAPKDRAKLARMATGLLALLIDLRCQAEEENTSTSPCFAGLRLLGEKRGPLTEIKCVMEQIADRLAPARGAAKIKKALRWTLDKKEIDVTLSRIE